LPRPRQRAQRRCGRPGRPADPAAQTGNNDDAGIDGEGDDRAQLPGDGDGAPLPGDDDGATPLDDENDFADEGDAEIDDDVDDDAHTAKEKAELAAVAEAAEAAFKVAAATAAAKNLPPALVRALSETAARAVRASKVLAGEFALRAHWLAQMTDWKLSRPDNEGYLLEKRQDNDAACTNKYRAPSRPFVARCATS
jgi:hypothetical protein